MRSASISLATLATLGLLTACTPGGVDVSDDWSGISAYTVVDIDGHVTVVGLDTEDAEARPMIVIPGQEDEDEVTGPKVVRRAGSTYVTRPAEAGRVTLYQVKTGDDAVNGVGVLDGDGPLAPTSDGWVQIQDGTIRLLDERLSETATHEVPAMSGAATDGAQTLCFVSADGAGVGKVDLATGKVLPSPPATGLDQVDVGCWKGRPVAVGLGGGKDGSRVRAGKPLSVALAADRLDRVVVEGDTLLAAVSVGDHQQIVEVDLRTRELVTTDLSTTEPTTDLVVVDGHLIVVGDTKATVVDRASGGEESVELPGAAFGA